MKFDNLFSKIENCECKDYSYLYYVQVQKWAVNQYSQNRVQKINLSAGFEKIVVHHFLVFEKECNKVGVKDEETIIQLYLDKYSKTMI